MADGRAMLTDAIKYHENQIKGLSAAISRIDEIRLLEADIKVKQAHLDQLKKVAPAEWQDPKKIPALMTALSRPPRDMSGAEYEAAWKAHRHEGVWCNKDKEKKEEKPTTPSFWGHPPGCMCPHCYEARTKTKIPKGMQVCRLGGLCDDKTGRCECSPCS